MTTDGGGVAAFGYRYQYLVTAEQFLRIITTHTGNLDEVALIVEPTSRDLAATSDEDDDVVDFAVEVDGTITRRIQVKASRVPSELNALRYSDTKSIFKRMSSGGEEAIILTNKRLAKKLRKACAEPTDLPDGSQQYVLAASEITGSQDGPVRSVVRDDRKLTDIKQSLLDLIRRIRGDRALGQGLSSASLLAALVMDSIFEAAANVTPRRRTADELLTLLCTPDAQIAHALRRFDWGAPLIEVPRLVSAVARTSELAELTELFTLSVNARNPKVSVLTGVTGFGKSTIAADFCHLNRHFYEHVMWIDCRTEGLIEAKFKDVIRQLGVEAESVVDVASAFQSQFARMGGPSVIVFDGARQRKDIERFVPTSGCGFVIVTTTNSTGWWHTAKSIPVDPFTEDEASACFETYAQIEPGTRTMVVTDIVNRLGRVPLAIAMAALHFRNADEDISQLSREYFAGLDALADQTSVPEGFDRTAFAAVRHAVAQLGSGADVLDEDRRMTQALVYHSAFLAPELIPLNLLLQTVHQTTTMDLTDPPLPEIADQAQRNRVLVTLRTQTIATRRSYLDSSGISNPASDTITVHPLVHEILRAIYKQAAPTERMLDLLTMLMACAYGWLIQLRREGAIFPLEQLLVHGEWILELVDRIAVPDTSDEHQLYVFRCAKLYLACEIANCAASQGEYTRSIDIIETALTEIQGVALTPHAQGMVTKAACDSVADAMLGGLDVDRAKALTRRALAELRKFGTIGNPRLGGVIATLSIQAGQAAKKFEDREMKRLAVRLLEFASMQTVTEMPQLGHVMQIHNLLSGGYASQALELVQRVRPPNASVYDRVMFDNFEVIANLHLGNFPNAADGIDRILSLADNGNHLHDHLKLTFEQIGDALLRTQDSWSSRSPRLRAKQLEVQRRRA
ncbi:ATP-binding protein [Rhodococcus sp. 7Tela_A2]|uniref:ATP-binding protein n=1 Tax=Rhodococcus sp. 7Tela_A2 TaxID=3093744 RepID=UPI003BB79893